MAPVVVGQQLALIILKVSSKPDDSLILPFQCLL